MVAFATTVPRKFRLNCDPTLQCTQPMRSRCNVCARRSSVPSRRQSFVLGTSVAEHRGMNARSTAPSQIIRDHFLADHRRLEDLFEDTLNAFEDGVREELSELWTRFESDLQRHMDAEEKFLLPAFARVNATEAQAVLADHEEFRRRIAELGVGVDLHIVRLAVASKFIDRLRAHAHREDELLYRWADENLDEGNRTSLLRALEQGFVKARLLRATSSRPKVTGPAER
jgi:hemerythrin-like domain-containing protein